MLNIFFGLLLLGVILVVLWLPAWWFAGRIDQAHIKSLVRLPVSLGLMLVGYITSVNLIGRIVENSIYAAVTYFLINLILSFYLLYKHRDALAISHLWVKKKLLITAALIALFLALPQWFQAVSGNRWDEVASSSIHLTAPNQFAEGVFPPRHNAFPDITIKYHYGFTLLSGLVHWVTGLSSNVSIDIVSTGLWLFTFLFVFFWVLDLGMSKVAAVWGGFAVLLGGGLSWLYLPWLEVYKGFQKLPPPEWLVHSYDAQSSWLHNLITVMRNQNVHLRNADGDLFALPFDIAIHYQQHAVALGIALTLVAAYLFWLWQLRREFALLLLICCSFTFGLVFLGHAVFGGIASVSAGLVLALLWLRHPTKIRFIQGIAFTLGVTVIAFSHGGMLSAGEEYGSGTILKLRGSFGYVTGSPLDVANWFLAGFGLPLVACGLSVWVWFRNRLKLTSQKFLFFGFFSIFGLVSYLIPQLFFFSHGTAIEEQTEISKFFFCTHLSVALVSILGIDYLAARYKWWMFSPLFAMSVVTPLAVSYAGAHEHVVDGDWQGFYKSPYDWRGGVSYMAMGKEFGRLKKSRFDSYYDFSTSERSKGFLSELLIYGGSVFTLSPTRYEVTGSGYLISEDFVRNRLLLEGRVDRLLPGSFEQAKVNWIYTSSAHNLALKPVIVRSRFAKMLATDLISKKFESGPFSLYRAEKETENLDQKIELHWSPKIISQANSDWDGDGERDLVFYDYVNKAILGTAHSIPLAQLPEPQSNYDFPMLFLAKLRGDDRADIILGRMADTLYRRGSTASEMIRQYQFHWRRRDSLTGKWQDSYQYWFWGSPVDIPIVADHDNDGIDSQLGFRPKTGRWSLYPGMQLDGPTLPKTKSPLPVIGRFLPESQGDLAVWSPNTGEFKVQNLDGGNRVTVNWGGRPGDILLPGDYDGDGRDELGLWQPHSNLWWVKILPAGPNLQTSFGSPTGIPLPFDYNIDGRLDLAYWEPGERKIYVSFDFGQSIAKTINTPPHSIPIFVHMY